MYNKSIIEFSFCDIQNNQGLGKCNQPRPPALADYTCLDLDYSGYHKNLIQLFFIIMGLFYTKKLITFFPLCSVGIQSISKTESCAN